MIPGIIFALSVPFVLGIWTARSTPSRTRSSAEDRKHWRKIGLRMFVGLALLCFVGYISNLDGAAGGVVLIGGGVAILILAPATIAVLLYVLGLHLGAPRSTLNQADNGAG